MLQSLQKPVRLGQGHPRGREVRVEHLMNKCFGMEGPPDEGTLCYRGIRAMHEGALCTSEVFGRSHR